MPRYFVKQPNNLIAIWSTIVDDFIALSLTREAAIKTEFYNPSYSNYPGGQDALRNDLYREMQNIDTAGRAWDWANNWDECVSWLEHARAKTLKIIDKHGIPRKMKGNGAP